MTAVVVDASVAVCWFAREAGTPAANQLLRRGADLVAPSLLLAEFANVVWKKERRGDMDPSQTEIALREIHRFIPDIAEMSKLLAPATVLARESDHSVYDCLYVALARERAIDFVTFDGKLVAAFAGTSACGRVFELGDWLSRQRGG